MLGYGHIGQAVVKKLKEDAMEYVIIEQNLKYYDEGIKKGENIIFGNASSKHILESVNIRQSCAVIVAIDNPEKLHLICEVIDDLTHNTKTIVKITKGSDKKALEYLHLEHIIVQDDIVAKALVAETKFCKI